MNLTLYQSAWARFGRPMQIDWPAVARALSHFRPVAGDDKRQCPAWSPVRYAEGATRSAAGVVDVHALVIDYDDGVTPAQAADRWHGYEVLVHTSWSHAPDSPRCRVVMPLASPIAGAIWRDVYRWVIAADGGEADGACCDPSRLYFLPAVGRGGPHGVIRRHGAMLDLAPVAARMVAEAERAEIDRRARLAAIRTRPVAGDLRAERQLLRDDPGARAALALRHGATEVGLYWRRMPCPACRRLTVYWHQDRGGARCQHQNTCGWWGSLHDYEVAG